MGGPTLHMWTSPPPCKHSWMASAWDWFRAWQGVWGAGMDTYAYARMTLILSSRLPLPKVRGEHFADAVQWFLGFPGMSPEPLICWGLLQLSMALGWGTGDPRQTGMAESQEWPAGLMA